MNQSTQSIKKTAFIILLLLAVVALTSLFLILGNAHRVTDSGKLFADIYQNGELLQSIPLDTVTESYTFTITGESGCQNEIQVRPGSIGILSADCPDKLCVKQGFINSSLLPITCLPNHLVIQLRMEDESAAEEPSVDIMTY